MIDIHPISHTLMDAFFMGERVIDLFLFTALPGKGSVATDIFMPTSLEVRKKRKKEKIE